MIDDWLRSIERLALHARAENTRVTGFISPDKGAGTSAVCNEMADLMGRSGLKTIVVDLTVPVRPGSAVAAWRPGTRGTAAIAETISSGFDRLQATPTPETRFLFNNVENLRWTLAEDLSAYQAVIVDLPSALDSGQDALSGTAMAAACDAIYLVCSMDTMRRPSLERMVRQLRESGAKIAGTVVTNTAPLKAGHGSVGDWIERKLQECEPF
jgi:hypothetical protein